MRLSLILIRQPNVMELVDMPIHLGDDELPEEAVTEILDENIDAGQAPVIVINPLKAVVWNEVTARYFIEAFNE